MDSGMTSHLTLKLSIPIPNSIITRNDAIKLIFVELFSVSQNAHCDTEVEKNICFPEFMFSPRDMWFWVCNISEIFSTLVFQKRQKLRYKVLICERRNVYAVTSTEKRSQGSSVKN
jgi:hypothetical protein